MYFVLREFQELNRLLTSCQYIINCMSTSSWLHVDCMLTACQLPVDHMSTCGWHSYRGHHSTDNLQCSLEQQKTMQGAPRGNTKLCIAIQPLFPYCWAYYMPRIHEGLTAALCRVRARSGHNLQSNIWSQYLHLLSSRWLIPIIIRNYTNNVAHQCAHAAPGRLLRQTHTAICYSLAHLGLKRDFFRAADIARWER